MVPIEIVGEIGSHANEHNWINITSSCKTYYNNLLLKRMRDSKRCIRYASEDLLLEAVRYHNIELIKEITETIDLNNYIFKNKDIQIAASETDDPIIVTMLLKKLNEKDRDGVFKEIYVNACFGCYEIIVGMYLADKNNHPDPFLWYGVSESTFGMVCDNGFDKLAKMIIQHPLAYVDSYNNYYLRKACECGFTEIVKVLLQNSEINPMCEKNEALVVATKSEHVKIVKLLLNDNRVVPDYPENIGLQVAINTNNIKLIKIYLNDGRIMESLARGYFLKKVVEVAVKNDNKEVLDLLTINNYYKVDFNC
jgi:hypothetical protein